MTADSSTPETREAVDELTEAIRLTVEYVGNDLLPPIEGWSWFDALTRYAPDVAAAFKLNPIHLPPSVAAAVAGRDAEIERLTHRIDTMIHTGAAGVVAADLAKANRRLGAVAALADEWQRLGPNGSQAGDILRTVLKGEGGLLETKASSLESVCPMHSNDPMVAAVRNNRRILGYDPQPCTCALTTVLAPVSGAVEGAGEARVCEECGTELHLENGRWVDLSGYTHELTPVAGHEQEVRAEATLARIETLLSIRTRKVTLNELRDALAARASGSSAPVQGGAE